MPKIQEKTKSYTSKEVRQIIVDRHLEGFGNAKIGRLVGIPRTTVRDIVKVFKERGSIDVLEKPGRPKKTTEAIDRKIVREVKKSPFTSLK